MKQHLAIVFWNLGIGGIQTRVNNIVTKILEVYPDSVITIMLYERKVHEVPIAIHPRVSIISFPGSFTIKSRLFTKKLWRFTTVQFVFWLYYQLTKQRPTHVVVFLNRLSFYIAWFVFVLKILRLAPRLIINEPVVLSTYLRRRDPHWWPKMISFSHGVADKIIVATNTVKIDLVKNFHTDPQKITVIRSWTK